MFVQCLSRYCRIKMPRNVELSESCDEVDETDTRRLVYSVSSMLNYAGSMTGANDHLDNMPIRAID